MAIIAHWSIRAGREMANIAHWSIRAGREMAIIARWSNWAGTEVAIIAHWPIEAGRDKAVIAHWSIGAGWKMAIIAHWNIGVGQEYVGYCTLVGWVRILFSLSFGKERIALVALFRRATRAISSLPLLKRSYYLFFCKSKAKKCDINL